MVNPPQGTSCAEPALADPALLVADR